MNQISSKMNYITTNKQLNILSKLTAPIIMIGLWILSSRTVYLPDLGLAWSDKLYHFIIYTILGIAVNFWIPERIRKDNNYMCLFLCFLISSLYGAVDEYHQSFVPGRVSSLTDLIADISGSFSGCLVVQIMHNHRSRKK